MSRPLIGIPMWNQGENSVGATKPYLEYLKGFGEIILLSPDAVIPNLNLLVLPGGKDIANGNPNDFSFFNSDNERFLEHFDAFTLPKYIELNTPILGICRGFQALMRHFQVPLIQHIWWTHGSSKDENDQKVNKLVYNKYHEYGQGKEDPVTTIGSWHHQGVSVASLKKQGDFDLIAYTKDSDNEDYQIVEYVEHKYLPIVGIQSHPERNQNKLDRMLIHSLLK